MARLRAAGGIACALGDEAQGDEPRPPSDPVVMEYDVGPRDTAGDVPALEAVPSPCVPSIDDLAALDDDALRDLGGRLLDELDRRNLDR